MREPFLPIDETNTTWSVKRRGIVYNLYATNNSTTIGGSLQCRHINGVQQLKMADLKLHLFTLKRVYNKGRRFLVLLAHHNMEL